MVILGLGCNVGDRLFSLREALKHLRILPQLNIIQVSPVYESDALLPKKAEPQWNMPYLNCALKCETKLEPEQLLTALKKIEKKMGRGERPHWSPRIMDIDILAWDNKSINTETLTIPHEFLTERPFAMWPLADLAPSWEYLGKTAQEIIKKWGSRFDGKAPLHTRQIAHRIDTPQMIGILNIAPESFSDGGKFSNIDAAIEQVQHLYKTGADIIDIGAESTRPGGVAITPEQEWQRLQPVLDAVNNLNLKLSIDTRNYTTAQKALAYNIDYLNDVTGFDDPKMRQLAAESKVKLIFMHHLAIPEDRSILLPFNEDPVVLVKQWAEKRLRELLNAGIDKNRLIFDVGIGFGKHAEQSFAIIKRISEFKSLDLPLLVGHSRKTFFGQFTDKPFMQRDLETAIISTFLAQQEVDYLRVHNVDAQMRALKISKALA